MDSGYQALTVFVTQLFLGGYVMLLMDFRLPLLKWRLRWLVLVGGLVLAHVALIALGHFAFYSRMAVLTLLVPYTLITVWCSKYGGMRTVFNISNGFYVGCICGFNGYLAAYFASSSSPFVPLVTRVVSLILCYFMLRKFGETYRQMLRQLSCGWLRLSLIPITTCLLTLYIYQTFFAQFPLTTAVIIYGIFIVCGCSYYLMYLFFEFVQKESNAQNSKQLLELQVSALQSRMEAIHAAEESIRIERHDMRHRLQAVAALVARGNGAAALEFLDAAQKRLDEAKPVRWCKPAVLDATFSSYFEQAQRQGIQIDARITLPDKLQIDEGELAIVFANALENAIHACMELPQAQRQIRCKAVGFPSIMLEISNPCPGMIDFDSNGLPIARRKGHGQGIQSICAFCQTHGAVCHFEINKGWFQFRMVL